MSKKLTIIALLAPVLIMGLLAFSAKAEEPTKQGPRNTLDQYPRIAAEWQSKTFLPIDLGEGLSNVVQQLFIYKTTSLSSEQESKLRGSIYNLVAAYHSGDYLDFQHFRTPIPGRINPEKLSIIKRRVGHTLGPGKPLPTDSETLLRLHFQSRNSGGGMKKLWIGLCKEETEITVNELKRPPESLAEIGMNKKNAGAACPIPTIKFDREPSSIIAKNGAVKICTVSILIKHSDPDPAYPYLCRFYWDLVSHEWLPLDLCFLWVNTAGLHRVVDF